MNYYEIRHVLAVEQGTAAVFVRGDKQVDLEKVWGLAAIAEEENGEPCFEVVSPLCAPPMRDMWGPTVLIPAIFIPGYAGMVEVSKRTELPKRVRFRRGRPVLPSQKLVRQVEELIDGLSFWTKETGGGEQDEEEATRPRAPGKVIDMRPYLTVYENRRASRSRERALCDIAKRHPDMRVADAMRLVEEEEKGDES